MITEAEVEQYIGEPGVVKTTDGDVFYGRYRYWELDVDDDIPNAMVFGPLDGTDLEGGAIEIEAAEIVEVRLYDSLRTTSRTA